MRKVVDQAELKTRKPEGNAPSNPVFLRTALSSSPIQIIHYLPSLLFPVYGMKCASQQRIANGNPVGRRACALAALPLPGCFDVSFSELLAYRRRTVNLYLRW